MGTDERRSLVKMCPCGSWDAMPSRIMRANIWVCAGCGKWLPVYLGGVVKPVPVGQPGEEQP